MLTYFSFQSWSNAAYNRKPKKRPISIVMDSTQRSSPFLRHELLIPNLISSQAKYKTLPHAHFKDVLKKLLFFSHAFIHSYPSVSLTKQHLSPGLASHLIITRMLAVVVPYFFSCGESKGFLLSVRVKFNVLKLSFL